MSRWSVGDFLAAVIIIFLAYLLVFSCVGARKDATRREGVTVKDVRTGECVHISGADVVGYRAVPCPPPSR